MIVVNIRKNESIDRALRRFKRKCLQAGIYKDFRKSSHYLKPSERRKLALSKSIRRQKRAKGNNHRN